MAALSVIVKVIFPHAKVEQSRIRANPEIIPSCLNRLLSSGSKYAEKMRAESKFNFPDENPFFWVISIAGSLIQPHLQIEVWETQRKITFIDGFSQ